MTRLPKPDPPTDDRLGVCQWFHYEAYEDVERAVDRMRDLGVRRLRTGISWADFHRPKGRQWYDWQMRQLAEFDLLVSIWHTPPSIAEGGKCSGPPVRLDDYGSFVGWMIELYGRWFNEVELWNEPNNRYKWDFQNHDPDWSKFARMVRTAGRIARGYGCRTVLGGMIPVDASWLRLVESHGGLEDVDVVAIHAFPGMWWPDHPNWDWRRDWKGWRAKLGVLADAAGGRPIWITETGLATWDLHARRPAREDEQARRLREAAAAPTERVYWYSLIDLDPEREAIEGFHVDENEYHMGLVTYDRREKPAYATMKELLAGGDSAGRESCAAVPALSPL